MAIPLQLMAMLAQLAGQNPDAAAAAGAATGQGPPSIAPAPRPFPVGQRPGSIFPGGPAGISPAQGLGGAPNLGAAPAGLANPAALNAPGAVNRPGANPLQGALQNVGAGAAGPAGPNPNSGAAAPPGKAGPSALEALQPPIPGQVLPPPGARTPGRGGSISPDILALLMQALSSQPPQVQSLGQILSQTK